MLGPDTVLKSLKSTMRIVWPLLAAAALIAGCANQNSESEVVVKPEDLPKQVTGQLKVGLLTPGSVNDSGWSSIAYQGLKAIEKELGAKVANEVTTDASIADAQRRFAQDGYHLVIGHGFEYNGPGAETSKAFPNTVFVSSSGGETTANAGAFRFYLEQSFYLCGILAGKQTKSNKVAMIGGPDVPSIRSTFKAFAAGAKAANPNVVVIEKFTGANDDVAKAKQATLQAISEGADFLIHQVNNAYAGFFGACEEKGVHSFGANYDQNSLSKSCVASGVITPEDVFVRLAKDVQQGHYKGKVELVGMKEGAVGFVLNPTYAATLDPAVRTLIDDTQIRIMEGGFNVPKDEF